MGEEPTPLPRYPKIYHIGHRAIRELFDGPVVVQEKIDGSQFSFGVRDGELFCRSRKKALDIAAPDGMFALAVTRAISLKDKLNEGCVFRCEYLRSPRHNTLAYDRVPKGNLMLFDVEYGGQNYLNHDELEMWAEELGIEVVPEFYCGDGVQIKTIGEFLERNSALGGCKIEGIVVKNYERWCPDGMTMMGKYVSEDFKELHQKNPDHKAPANADIFEKLNATLRSEARWTKAMHHLRDEGELQWEPQDIPKLIHFVQEDIQAECMHEIHALLWGWAKRKAMKGAVGGLPEWYKRQLLEAQFDE
jgi:hypothetical protein